MRRQHNPRGITSQPVDGTALVRSTFLHLDMGFSIPFVHCVDCGLGMPLSEVPVEIAEHEPIRCGDCQCIALTGEQCEYSTEVYDGTCTH